MGRFARIVLCLVLLFFAGCNACNKNKSRAKPDVSDIKTDVHLMRFDQGLFRLNENNFLQQQDEMRSKYDSFYDFYVSHFIVGPRQMGDTARVEEDAVRNFIHDGYMRRLQDSINLHFNDTRDLENELSLSLRYFKYYFPSATVPMVVAINSGFSLGAFTYDKEILGIGLDLYLGADNPDYDSAGIYQYARHKLSPEYITRNAMEVLYNLYFERENPAQRKTLIEAIVNKGKKMYFLSTVLPDAPDSLIVGFTEKQTKWCESSEYEIWKFLNDKDLLYKSDYMEQKRYLDEGPSTAGMPPEAPGSIGNWIGLQVVRKFMKETGNKISLPDLITKFDGKTILEKAKYRPAKSIF